MTHGEEKQVFHRKRFAAWGYWAVVAGAVPAAVLCAIGVPRALDMASWLAGLLAFFTILFTLGSFAGIAVYLNETRKVSFDEDGFMLETPKGQNTYRWRDLQWSGMHLRSRKRCDLWLYINERPVLIPLDSFKGGLELGQAFLRKRPKVPKLWNLPESSIWSSIGLLLALPSVLLLILVLMESRGHWGLSVLIPAFLVGCLFMGVGWLERIPKIEEAGIHTSYSVVRWSQIESIVLEVFGKSRTERARLKAPDDRFTLNKGEYYVLLRDFAMAKATNAQMQDTRLGQPEKKKTADPEDEDVVSAA